MEDSKLIREKKALNRLFRLTVIGSVFIVVVYSVYYYANAYKYTRTNIVYAASEDGVRVNGRMDTVVGDVNLIFTDNIHFAKKNALNGWYNETQTQYELSQNSRTTVGLAGMMEEGFFEAFNGEMRKHFHSIPPIDLDQKSTGMVVRSIQFEHFVFPYHAMINWGRKEGVKTFSFYRDSLDGEIKGLPRGGFSWSSKNGESRISIQPCHPGDSIEKLVDQVLKESDSIELPSIIELPIVDFDLLFSERGLTDSQFSKGVAKEPVVSSTGEVKLLVGPSLKQGNAYEIDTSGHQLHRITPPFMLFLQKKDEHRPYFIALLANEKLLLK